MRHLKKFNEDLEPELINAINFLKQKRKSTTIDIPEREKEEDLNLERMEKDVIFKTISKYWYLPYEKIAEILGFDTRTLKRKLKEYDFENLKRQLKSRLGKGWDHPYNQIKLERFNGFISEIHKIKNYDTSTKNIKYMDVILDDPQSFSSPSHAILLKRKLQDLEDSEILKTLKNVKKMTPSHRSMFFRTKLQRGLAIPLNNLQFLKDRQREIGELRCEYCKKGPLTVYDFNPEELKWYKVKDKMKIQRQMIMFKPEDGATCDHKEPISKGGNEFDYENLAVACYDCNKKKGNMSWIDWMKKMGLEE